MQAMSHTFNFRCRFSVIFLEDFLILTASHEYAVKPA